MAGKGSRQRPTDWEKFNAEYDRIFMAKKYQPGTKVECRSTGRTGEIVDTLSSQYYVLWDDETEQFVFHDEVKGVRV